MTYLVRTVWFSIKSLERTTRYILSAKDYISAYSKPDMYESLIMDLSKVIQMNKRINNSKVDNMTMAMEYFKRAIIFLSLFGFLNVAKWIILN
jgi:hypothetical protein